ncbi:sugar diacid recognition domain-containing protein [Kutzneria buriramensis]|uniref:CdaR family transcriptional regulator n=1 Tax=Kutzneria buriramensis TaxID=1045776 RepID=UPI001B867FCF|nr:sugar diacid recognition domain-containing protein [Kutzneria buriramensis]
MDDSYGPLTADLAQEIAAETSRIVGFNVLVTDRDGTVIGSGDTARVGTLHEASVDVMRTLEPAWHDAEQARRLRGVRPGMTLPIVLDGEALGTVGITGSPRQVRRFGLLVQRHTEILVREAILLRSRLLRDRAVADLVRDIVSFDPDVVSAQAVERRAADLGIDLRRPRTAVVIDTADARLVRSVFPEPTEIATGRFVVLHHGDTAALCRTLAERGDVHIGLSDPAVGVAALHEACRDAVDAIAVGDGPVRPISALRVHQLLAAAGPHARSRFAEVTLGGLRAEPDWPALRATLVAWSESGCNLVRAAEALHIHRNTLVYRLDKLTELLGRPVREPAVGLALHLACLVCNPN